MKFKFLIPAKMIEQAFGFAEDIASKQAQSQRDFGSGKVRGKNDFIADTVEGKLAEEGFSSFLSHNFGIDMTVDYEIYADKTETDYGNDLQEITIRERIRMSLFKVDIKSTRPYAQWILVERHKFIANAFIMVSISGMNDDWERNPYGSRRNKLYATVIGFAYYTDFIDLQTRKPWFLFKQGDPLIKEQDVRKVVRDLKKITPMTIRRKLKIRIRNKKIKPMNVQLKSPINYALPKQWLRNDEEEWKTVIEMIRVTSLRPTNSIVSRLIKEA